VKFLKRSRILLLNLNKEITSSPNFYSIAGDATALPQFQDKEFDLVFSNSVIEHVGSFGKQKQMADEICRIGKTYFVQTPNRYFPIEPHFLFPFFQFLPQSIETWAIRHFNLGHISRIPDQHKAIDLVKSIRLLTKKEMSFLFPDGEIYTEKFLIFNKSFIAYRFPIFH